MDVQAKAGNGFTTLSITGRLDAMSAADAETAINKTIETGACRLVLNLARLDYVSSAGLRILLATAKKLSRQNGKLVLCELQKGVREVLEISGMLAIFPVAANEEAAQALVTE